MTGEWFAAWATQALAPTLRRGDIVILDNLPAHKSAAARIAIEASGTRLRFLPPYSPDFNPIEAARTPDALWRAIGEAIDRFTKRECRNYFATAGYDAW